MRIGINAWFWESHTTGSGQYTRQLVQHLVLLDHGLDLVLVAPRGRLSDPRAGGTGVRAERLGMARGLRPPLAKVYFEQVAFPHACRRLEVDVAHVPYWAPPWRCDAPIVTTIHDLIPLLLPEYRGGPLVRLYTALVSATARRSHLALTDSEASRRDIMDRLRLPAERIRSIPLAAEARYSPVAAQDDPAIRARLGLPPRYVLYLGGFDVRKNLGTVLRACLYAAPAVGPDCPLIIAGHLPEQDDSFTPDPRRLARELSVDPAAVRYVAPSEAEKPALYRGAQVFLFPSRYEGFGLPPLEALACGTPVVGGAAGSLPEVVGDAGLLLEPDDAPGMGAALARLLDSAALRSEFSRRALAQAAHFSWQRTARETMAAYVDAVSGCKPVR